MKMIWIGQSAAKPRTGERSTTILYGSRLASYWRAEVVGTHLGEDIVYTLSKDKGPQGRRGVASVCVFKC